LRKEKEELVWKEEFVQILFDKCQDKKSLSWLSLRRRRESPQIVALSSLALVDLVFPLELMKKRQRRRRWRRRRWI
jgi:hypothetical protein